MSEHFSKANPLLQLFWDSTSLRSFQRCPREYYYRILSGWVTRRAKLDLEFGIAYHSALEAGDRLRVRGESVPAQIRASVERAIRLPEFEDYTKEKNRFTLVRSIIWYYAQPRLPNPVNESSIEFSFRFALDSQAYTGESFGLCGHLDGVVVEASDQIYVNERKTTKGYASDDYWRRFSPDTQISLYTLAAKVVFPFPVEGVVVDALFTSENFSEFGSRPINRNSDVLEEFRNDIQISFRLAEQFAKQNYFPKNESACYLCPFKEVCSAPHAARDGILESNFIKRPWNPLEER